MLCLRFRQAESRRQSSKRCCISGILSREYRISFPFPFPWLWIPVKVRRARSSAFASFYPASLQAGPLSLRSSTSLSLPLRLGSFFLLLLLLLFFASAAAAVCVFFANARLRCKAELMGAISYTLCAMDAINLLISRTRRGRATTLHSWAWPSDLAGPGPVSAIEPQSVVVLIPSLRCAYNKKKLRKFAKHSDMNFFLLFTKNEGATTVEPRLRPKSSTRDPVWGSSSVSGVSRGGCGSSWSASKRPRLSTPILQRDSKPVSRGAQHDLGLKLR